MKSLYAIKKINFISQDCSKWILPEGDMRTMPSPAPEKDPDSAGRKGYPGGCMAQTSPQSVIKRQFIPSRRA